MKIYLDDVRPCPEGWVLVRNGWELYPYLGKIDIIDLDHDLGEGIPDGCDILNSLIILGYKGPIKIHSANPWGRSHLASTAEASNIAYEVYLP